MKTFLLSLLLCCGLAQAQTLKSGVFEPPRAAPEIALPASTGKPFKLSSLRGKVVVLEFGYTHCPYVCPVSLASLAQARAQLGAAAADVQVVFVTVDPERDTAGHLRTYLAKFDMGESLGTKAFFAAVIGGFNNSRGALLGGVIVGVVENLAAAYISPAYKDAVALVLFLIVILFMPQGLMGKRVERKV